MLTFKLVFVAKFKGNWRRVILWFETELERNKKIKELLKRYPSNSYYMKEEAQQTDLSHPQGTYKPSDGI